MKVMILLALNLFLVGLFVYLLRMRGLLTYYRSGRLWLTWMGIGIITLMDEFTSIFYVPAESYRFIGSSAIIFIALTSLLIRLLSTRFVEIAEILEHHGLIGGGVYSFSYLVLGPVVSFVAVSSIMVDYILTACISAVSAVLNASSFFPAISDSPLLVQSLVLAAIWFVAGLNILGIRENVRFTFAIFIFAAVVILNLIVSGLMDLDHASVEQIKESGRQAVASTQGGSWIETYGNFIKNIAFCILAYSGIESVIQTAGFVENWRAIKKAYLFLALTVGVVTPLVAVLTLSAPIDFPEHEGDLITYFATLLNGVWFGVTVAVLASFTLLMAVNTAFVASSELIERVAHRYGFQWIIATNRSNSLYRIHILDAILFSAIVLITSGSQKILADMYAIGIVASFCINMGSLIIYRYFMGTKEVIPYSTSRLGTLALFVVLTSCFVFLAWDKPHGTALWGLLTCIVLTSGIIVSKKRRPEKAEVAQAESEMEVILYLAEAASRDLNIFFSRPREDSAVPDRRNDVYVSFFSPRQGIPARAGVNHFRLPFGKAGIYHRMVAFLKVIEYELSDRVITVHFGWPMSSWLDRISIGVMVFKMMKLPTLFPKFNFDIGYKPALEIGRKGEVHG
ncbi:MAG: APC family permease [Deltaproteobacteria bacterium]|nr:APC family permease [Deltaproteobacteria bacterium]